MRPINSYCDYGFVPELVPSGQFSILNDSDDFFMLELQPLMQERYLIHSGTTSPRKIANELARWVTAEHRHFSKVDIVFRTGELPATFNKNRAGLADYIEKLQRSMPHRPLNHVDHIYWVLGMQAWAASKYGNSEQTQEMPPEVDNNIAALARSSIKRWIIRALINAYARLIKRMRIMAGTIPNVPIWNHLWLDSRLIHNWIQAMRLRPNQRSLLIYGESTPLSKVLLKMTAVRRVS